MQPLTSASRYDTISRKDFAVVQTVAANGKGQILSRHCLVDLRLRECHCAPRRIREKGAIGTTIPFSPGLWIGNGWPETRLPKYL